MSRLVDEMQREARRHRGREAGYRMAGDTELQAKARRIAAALELAIKEMTDV